MINKQNFIYGKSFTAAECIRILRRLNKRWRNEQNTIYTSNFNYFK